MWTSLWLLQREGKEEVFSFCKKEGFEFSHSPEHAFTSGAIYCLKAEIFWASPHLMHTYFPSQSLSLSLHIIRLYVTLLHTQLRGFSLIAAGSGPYYPR